jgi:hypothetical protein
VSEPLAPLIDRWLDGELDEAGIAELHRRLAEDATLRAEFVSDVRFQGAIAGLLGDDAEAVLKRVDAVIAASSASGPQRLVADLERRLGEEHVHDDAPVDRRRRPVPRPSRRLRLARPRPWPQLAALAACLVAMVGVAALLLSRPAPQPSPAPTVAEQPTTRPARSPEAPEVATVVALDGAAAIAHGIAHRAAAAGAALRDGDELAVESGTATVAYADGTRLGLSAGASATLALEHGAKRVRLARGALSAEVAKQPPGAAMVLATDEATATVVGTAFTLAREDGATRLAVSEGRIAFAPIGGGDALAVSAGESAVARAGAVTAEAHLAQAGAAIEPRPGEESWLGLGWELDLHAAQRRAFAERKPLLVWAAWGHPLGGADNEAFPDRAGALGDAEIARLIADRFVPVAIDTWWYSKRDDEAGRLFMRVAAPGTTRDGFYLLAPDGASLGFVHCDRPRELREALVQALDRRDAIAREVPAAGVADAAHDPQPPPRALAALVRSRPLARDGSGWKAAGPAGRDHLWLDEREWRALIAAATSPDEHGAIDPAVARKIAGYALCDASRGEPATWEPDHVREIALEATALEATPGRLRLRLSGRARCEVEGRGYAPELEGELVYDRTRDAITALRLVALGERWGAEPNAEGAPERETLGVLIELATTAPDDRVPPHGVRSSPEFYYAAPAVGR